MHTISARHVNPDAAGARPAVMADAKSGSGQGGGGSGRAEPSPAARSLARRLCAELAANPGLHVRREWACSVLDRRMTREPSAAPSRQWLLKRALDENAKVMGAEAIPKAVLSESESVVSVDPSAHAPRPALAHVSRRTYVPTVGLWLCRPSSKAQWCFNCRYANVCTRPGPLPHDRSRGGGWLTN